MAISKINASSINLADTFAFTGSVSGAGKVLAQKSANFQGTQTHTGNTHVQVTDLSITHTMANSSNKIVLLAHIGCSQTISGGSLSGTSAFSFAVDGSRPTSLIGTAASNRPGVTARNGARGVNVDHSPGGIALMGTYEPGDTSSHTYTVQVFCQTGETAYINKVLGDDDDLNESYESRSNSTFMLMEVSA